VVEDNFEMQDYLKLVLKDYRVLVVSNGHGALEILKKESPSAIITDFMMPIMNGLEFVKELQNLSIKIPVIVLTARNEEIDRLKMLRIGIDAYFTKPFIEEELLLRLSNSINYYRQIQSFEQNLPESEKLNLSNQESNFYDQMISIIEKNYSSKSFGVEQLAEIMNISRSSLFRKTKYILGQTPNEVIKEMRFQKARLILINKPNVSKKELADAVGIYNATYFFNNLKNRFKGNDSK
jgi:DNA-binding response OmpR family regulator